MRVLQVTNILSHLQLPVARCLVSRLGEARFRFVSTEAPHEERVRLGWNFGDSDTWILRAGECEADRRQFLQWCEEADVVLSGERQLAMFANRIRRGKLTLYMSERWWKPPLGMGRLLHPRYLSMALRFARLAQDPSFHFLAIGGYAASDMRRLAPFPGRMWNWGYFTAKPDPVPDPSSRGHTVEVLWAGRMLSWKRVDTLLHALAMLRQQGVSAHLTLIGDGPCRCQLQHIADRLCLVDNVAFRASMSVAQVRQHMRMADIYVFPSNGYEGWGAVVNEAMYEGCAVVASEAAGSAKTMIRHRENGLLFQAGDWRQLGEQLAELAANDALRLRLAQAGQRTVVEKWSPDVGAQRLLSVCEALLAGHVVPEYTEGPMVRV